jgi:5-methylcytosine-specific restriction endonuclease McrA
MRRKRPFLSPERRSVPRRVRAEIMLRQQGRCADCGTRLIMGFIVFDHRPPIGLRDEADDVSDLDRLAAICWTCHEQKTPTDLRSIAKAKRIAEKHQDFLERQAGKVPGRRVPSRKERQEIERIIGMQPRRGLADL